MAATKKPKIISIIIPTYNEEKTIKKLITRVNNASYMGLKKEIIVIDDGSSDKTTEIIKKIHSPKIFPLFHKTNKGKGAALRTGFKKAKGDIVVVQDADSEYDPDEIKLLLVPILRDGADVVYGSRFANNRPHRVLYFWHSVGNSLLTLLSNALTNLNFTDIETGYKMFKKEVLDIVLPKLTSNRFGFEPEVTALIAKLSKKNSIKIYEVGISYHGRTYKEGKKINWKDGIAAFWYILKFNFLTRG